MGVDNNIQPNPFVAVELLLFSFRNTEFTFAKVRMIYRSFSQGVLEQSLVLSLFAREMRLVLQAPVTSALTSASKQYLIPIPLIIPLPHPYCLMML